MGDVIILEENLHEQRKGKKRKLSKKSENEVEVLPANTLEIKKKSEELEEGETKKQKLKSVDESGEENEDENMNEGVKKPPKFYAKDFRQKLQTKSAYEGKVF